MKRVVILGSSGAGKTTLANKISALTGLPIIHLDKHFWLPNWQARSNEEFARRQRPLIASDSWIFDGNNRNTLPIRLERADTAILLDFPRWLCLFRILTRSAWYFRRTREDMADGCKERFSWEFIKYVWNFPEHYRPSLFSALSNFKGQTIILKSPKDVRTFLKSLSRIDTPS